MSETTFPVGSQQHFAALLVTARELRAEVMQALDDEPRARIQQRLERELREIDRLIGRIEARLAH